MLTILDGKGRKNRSLPLPETSLLDIRRQIDGKGEFTGKTLEKGL
ncbi:hypothetical protein [Desulfobacula sp.]|nr:hypothetical protein [Desulfobacula sp.]